MRLKLARLLGYRPFRSLPDYKVHDMLLLLAAIGMVLMYAVPRWNSLFGPRTEDWWFQLYSEVCVVVLAIAAILLVVEVAVVMLGRRKWSRRLSVSINTYRLDAIIADADFLAWLDMNMGNLWIKQTYPTAVINYVHEPFGVDGVPQDVLLERAVTYKSTAIFRGKSNK